MCPVSLFYPVSLPVCLSVFLLVSSPLTRSLQIEFTWCIGFNPQILLISSLEFRGENVLLVPEQRGGRCGRGKYITSCHLVISFHRQAPAFRPPTQQALISVSGGLSEALLVISCHEMDLLKSHHRLITDATKSVFECEGGNSAAPSPHKSPS